MSHKKTLTLHQKKITVSTRAHPCRKPHQVYHYCVLNRSTFLPTDEDDLYDISKDLTSLAAKWKEIGIALRLRCGVLDKIDSGRPDRCLSYVIENWLKKNYNATKFGPPTWRWLVEIVADPAGGNDRALADEIAKKHLIGNKPGKFCDWGVLYLRPAPASSETCHLNCHYHLSSNDMPTFNGCSTVDLSIVYSIASNK